MVCRASFKFLYQETSATSSEHVPVSTAAVGIETFGHSNCTGGERVVGYEQISKKEFQIICGGVKEVRQSPWFGEEGMPYMRSGRFKKAHPLCD